LLSRGLYLSRFLSGLFPTGRSSGCLFFLPDFGATPLGWRWRFTVCFSRLCLCRSLARGWSAMVHHYPGLSFSGRLLFYHDYLAALAVILSAAS
jgi:hypothetical protein